MTNKRILSTLLALAILLSCVGWTPVQAQGTAPEEETIDTVTQIMDNEDSPKYVDAEQFEEAGHVQRLHDEEELDTYVYLNEDGSKSVYYMDQDVKFVDEQGNIREKDISLVRSKQGYSTKSNDIGLYIPDSAADGITVSHKSREVKLLPVGGTGLAAANNNSILYSNFFGRGIHLQYTPMLSGVKEDVIITKYTGVNSFSFLLETGGLYLYDNDGRYYLAESATAKAAFDLGEVLVYDAIGRPDMGTMTVETVIPGQRYKLTISANEAFLTDPETLYPVTIDPTLTVSDNTHNTGAIQDAPVFSGKPSKNFGSYVYNTIGYHSADYGTAMTVVRLAGLLSDETYVALKASNIINATFYMKDGGSSSAAVNIHAVTGNFTWTESNVTWSNLGEYSETVSETVSATDTMGGGNWGEFDITSLVRSWKSGTNNGQRGFVMVIGDSTKKIGTLSSEYSNTDYRPYVVVTYGFDPFYSDYASADAYRNTVIGSDKIEPETGDSPIDICADDGLQWRANCYGYAFRFFYADAFVGDMIKDTVYDNFYATYAQKPGEFADKNGIIIYDTDGSQLLTLNNRNDLETLYTRLYNFDNNSRRMHILEQLLRADADTLDYEITEYTGETIPDAATLIGKRLIAVVITQRDFHFYMQHSDNTWSHKQGSRQPTDTSIDQVTKLTNENIRSEACEGMYSGAAIKFFYITKDAIIDYGHLDGLAPTCTGTATPNVERAGNTIFNAKHIGVAPTACESANIDYVNDVDYYAFISGAPGSYTFETAVTTSMPLEIALYSCSGELLYTAKTTTGTTSFTYSLQGYTEYLIAIRSPNQAVHQFRRFYSIAIDRT